MTNHQTMAHPGNSLDFFWAPGVTHFAWPHSFEWLLLGWAWLRDGFLEYAGRRFSVDDLIQIRAVSCDLCHRSIQEARQGEIPGERRRAQW